MVPNFACVIMNDCLGKDWNKKVMVNFNYITSGFLTTFIVAATVLILANFAFAHGDGASVEQVIDGYLVDVGYSPEIPLANEQTSLNFAIYSSDTRDEILFTDIWVRIIDEDNKLLFAGGLNKAEFGLTGLTYSFSKPGAYDVFVRFSDGRDTIVEATAPIIVSKQPKEFSLSFGISETLAFLVGLIVSFIAAYILFIRFRLLPQKSTTTLESRVHSESEPLENNFSYRNLTVLVLVSFVCVALAFYATKMVLSRDRIPVSDSVSEQSIQEGEVSIVLTNKGFMPAEVTVKKGTTITFSTDVDRPFWPASNLHPTHEEYAAFDPKQEIPPDETWSFTFDQVGDWNMHDHLRSYFVGSINVVE